MVKLYYSPTSCGAASFISAFISGIKIDCESVNLFNHRTASGIDFYTINPKGNVPCIVLDDGRILNENIACLEYIADIAQKSEQFKNISPQNGTDDSYILKQHLSYIASELHATIGLFFNPDAGDETIRSFIMKNFEKKMSYLQLNLLSYEKTFLIENFLTIADIYLHIVLSWTHYIDIDLDNYPVAKSYYDKICSLEEIKLAKDRMNTNPETTL